ncbi:hypothetical protein QN404_24135 [Pseudomonas sp. RTS1]|uniref:hypothetical protein n=1 Tax=unclassified Pseudomonas TaxID=196821 RepID=UPI002B23C6F4|nr:MULTISPECIES: hypothetical protein [unclassified Pseudomonas]MEA9991986.1 hypothetical protein [Pseudomonas sp. RTS1]MEB0037707.1 hypothetical protein [Pseudomonas sp. RTS2]MEB0237610.1 hypothetical protein [Pseudomonas sp. 5S3]MEB0254374.1 hypothetical protein [Pseudomonas sp. 5S2]
MAGLTKPFRQLNDFLPYAVSFENFPTATLTFLRALLEALQQALSLQIMRNGTDDYSKYLGRIGKPNSASSAFSFLRRIGLPWLPLKLVIATIGHRPHPGRAGLYPGSIMLIAVHKGYIGRVRSSLSTLRCRVSRLSIAGVVFFIFAGA